MGHRDLHLLFDRQGKETMTGVAERCERLRRDGVATGVKETETAAGSADLLRCTAARGLIRAKQGRNVDDGKAPNCHARTVARRAARLKLPDFI